MTQVRFSTNPRAIRQDLAEQALQKAAEIRDRLDYDLLAPVCVYRLSEELGVEVQTIDVSMEGLYHTRANQKPRILLGAERPLGRRVFTCGHELGHHVFEHGDSFDEVQRGFGPRDTFEPNEFLADVFSGYLLMPKLGIIAAFRRRGWNPEQPSPVQAFVVACEFGVGYTTLVHHMTWSLRLLSRSRSEALRQWRLPSIRERLLGRPSTAPLWVVDRLGERPAHDVEVGMEILLPKAAISESDALQPLGPTRRGRLYRAVHRGIHRVYDPESDWAVFIRVADQAWVGRYRFRHFVARASGDDNE